LCPLVNGADVVNRNGSFCHDAFDLQQQR
jgi:hypothetical protein